MKVVELDKAKGSLSDYARRNRRHAVVVTRRGKPVSALLSDGTTTRRQVTFLDTSFLYALFNPKTRITNGSGIQGNGDNHNCHSSPFPVGWTP